MSKFYLYFPVLVFVSLCSCQGPEITQTRHGIKIKYPEAILSVEVCSPKIIRISYSAFDSMPHASLMVNASWEDTSWDVQKTSRSYRLLTEDLMVEVNRMTGAVSFHDHDGKLLLREEQGGGRMLKKITLPEDAGYEIRQKFSLQEDEAIYGLGQHQHHLMNLRGYDVDLWQDNMAAVVPFLVSTRGYGLLWDNNSRTRFGNLSDPEPLPHDALILPDSSGKGLRVELYRNGKLISGHNVPEVNMNLLDSANLFASHYDRFRVEWTGSFTPPHTGWYEIYKLADGDTRLWIDDRLLIEHWIPYWVRYDMGRIWLEKGKSYPLRMEWENQGQHSQIRLMWKNIRENPDEMSLWSEIGDGIDYYFCYGPSLDEAIAGYREITGTAPVMPKWAMGYFQFRERYKTANESLDILKRFRQLRIPIDVIVQDWQYWKSEEWGSHAFDHERFPNPEQWIETIHKTYNARLMISVWPKFYPGTDNFRALEEKGFLYRKNLEEKTRDWLGNVYTYYDAFHPEARKLYWQQMNENLFSKGVDAWWMDGTEPEMLSTIWPADNASRMHPTYPGSGARYLNAYSLVNSQAVYEGQRSVTPNQRVFILTRSAFAGQQRYASATWSGDITSRWNIFKKQIPARLNFCMSGIPYWATDIGGFTTNFQPTQT